MAETAPSMRGEAKGLEDAGCERDNHTDVTSEFLAAIRAHAMVAAIDDA